MEVLINGETAAIDVEGLTTFHQLMEHLQKTLVQHPRVITRVVLNEEELDESQEIGLGAFPISDIASLAIHTVDRLDLAYESLQDAQEYLPQLSSILEQSAKAIREGNIKQGLQSASEVLEYVGAFGEVLEGLRGTFQIDFSLVRIDDFTLLDKLYQLNQQASDVLKAVKDEDWTLFADLVEYEISPLLYEWMAVIPEIMKLLPDKGGEEEG